MEMSRNKGDVLMNFGQIQVDAEFYDWRGRPEIQGSEIQGSLGFGPPKINEESFCLGVQSAWMKRVKITFRNVSTENLADPPR